MMCRYALALSALWGAGGIIIGVVAAQDATKLAPIYQQQRNAVFDGLAQCNVQLADLHARITDLENQLAEAKK